MHKGSAPVLLKSFELCMSSFIPLIKIFVHNLTSLSLMQEFEVIKMEYQQKLSALNKKKQRGVGSSLERAKSAASHLHTKYEQRGCLSCSPLEAEGGGLEQTILRRPAGGDEHGGTAAQRLLLRPRPRQQRRRHVLQLPRLLRRARRRLHRPPLGGRRLIRAAIGRGNGRRRKPSEGASQLRAQPPRTRSLRRAEDGSDPPVAREETDFDLGTYL